MNCEFCNNTFSTKYVLKNHQKRAKYCIKFQKSKGNEVTVDLYKCEHCFLEMAVENKKRHLNTCKMKNKNIMAIHEKKLVEHEKMLVEYEKIIAVQNKELEEVYKQIEIYKGISERELSCMEEIAKQPHHVFHNEAVIEIEPETDSDDDEENQECELVPLDLGEGYEIEHREEDGYINVSNLCKAGGEKFKAWNRLQKTKAFLQVLSASVLIHTDELIKYTPGSNNERATWVHPQVAINIAQWISPNFDVKVSAWVYEVMMSGKVDITNTKTYRQLQKENKGQKLRIQHLTKKYVKKQPRLQIIETNVVYILTTKLMKKERRYILGKATNLTNRLSTYNKSDEHQIVYYQGCGDEDNMGVVETMVFNKLRAYREQANRERFVLPEDKEVSLFVDTIKECVSFVSFVSK